RRSVHHVRTGPSADAVRGALGAADARGAGSESVVRSHAPFPPLGPPSCGLAGTVVVRRPIQWGAACLALRVAVISVWPPSPRPAPRGGAGRRRSGPLQRRQHAISKAVADGVG